VTTTSGTEPRGALRLMIDPVFGGMFWGKLLATLGVFVHSIVAAVVVYEATGSALMVGLVTVAQFAPQLALSPLSGTWADRGHAARQIVVGRAMCLAGSGSIALWTWLAPEADGNAAAIPVLVASLVVGLGFVVGGPAMNSIVPSLIRPGELGTAMALNTAPSTVGRIAGPAAGAFVTAHFGAGWGFALAAATHLVFLVIMLVVRLPAPPRHPEGVDYSVRAALRHVWRDRPLLVLLLAIAAIGFGSEPSLTLAPALAAQLDGGTALVGELSASFGLGAGVGLVIISAVNRRIRPAVTSSTGLWLMVAGLAAVPVGTVAPVVLAAFAVAGFGFSWAMTGVSTLVQERVPDELRGRVMALWMVGFVGSRPLAAALVGVLADGVSVAAAFWATAAILVLAAAFCRPRLIEDAKVSGSARG
jgi:MFS family permease